MKYKQSRFVFDVETMTVVEGKAPTKDGQLWKGETTTGRKMELAGQTEHKFFNPDAQPVAYDGWSN